MKAAYLVTLIFVFCCRVSLALYGPDTDRVPVAVSTVACEQADFLQGRAIVRALQSSNVSDALAVLPAAMSEWQNTPMASGRYAARAFCVHELIPKEIVMGPQPIPSAVAQMRAIGIGYYYYEPDARWFNGPNPVNLVALATGHLDSPWGRQAFPYDDAIGVEFRELQRRPRSVLHRHQTRQQVSQTISALGSFQ